MTYDVYSSISPYFVYRYSELVIPTDADTRHVQDQSTDIEVGTWI